MAEEAALDLILRLQDEASKGLDDVAKHGGFLQDALSFATGGLVEKGIETITGSLGDFFSGAIDESTTWNAAMSQTEAVIKSTGGAAGLTADQMGDLAGSLSGANGMSMAADDAVLAGENLLATFTNIKGGVFKDATATMVDMAAAMGTDVKGGAIQLGKALNDPIAGISALSRVGVTFTDQQKDQIAAMMKAGDTAGAQNVILKELNKEFGGSAKAAADANGGMFQLSEQFANVKQTVGDALLPILHELVGFIASPAVMGVIQGLADLVAGGLTQGFQFLLGVWTALQPTLRTLGDALGVVARAASALFGALAPVGAFLAQHWDAILLGLGIAISGFVIPALIGLGTTLFTVTIPAFIAVAAPLIAAAAPFIALGAAVAAVKIAFDNNFLGLRDLVQPILTGIMTTVGQFVGLLQAAFGGGLKLDALQQLPGWLQPIGLLFGTIAENVGEFFRAVQGGTPFLQALGDLIQNTIVDALTLLGVKQADAVNAINGFKEVLGQVGAFITGTVFPALGALAGWLGEQIPKVIQLAADAWNNVLAPALQAVWSFIQANVLPILGQVAGWLQTNVPQALQTLANFWNTTLLPALQAAWAYFNGNILPILQQVWTWLQTNVPQALQTLANFWNTTLLPALQAVWTFFTTSILPVLGTVVSTILNNVGPALSGLATIWNTVLLPAITAVWNFFTTSILPLLQALSDVVTKVVNLALTAMAGIFQNVILPAVTAVWNFISSSLAPVFSSLSAKGGPIDSTGGALSQIALVWDTVLQPAVSAMAGFLGGALKSAFDGIGSAISTVTGFLNTLSSGLDNITLPDWMTPGSPTPWENGLVGIAGALQHVTGTALPSLAGAFGSLTAGATAQGKAGPMTPLVDGMQTFAATVGQLPTLTQTGLAALPEAFRAALTGAAAVITAAGDPHVDGGIAAAWFGAKGLLPELLARVGNTAEVAGGGFSFVPNVVAALAGMVNTLIPDTLHGGMSAILGDWTSDWNSMKGTVHDAVQDILSNMQQLNTSVTLTIATSSGAGGGGPGAPSSGGGGAGGGGGGGTVQANAGGLGGGGGITVWVMVPGLGVLAGQATTKQSEALRWQQELGRLADA